MVLTSVYVKLFEVESSAKVTESREPIDGCGEAGSICTKPQMNNSQLKLLSLCFNQVFQVRGTLQSLKTAAKQDEPILIVASRGLHASKSKSPAGGGGGGK